MSRGHIVTGLDIGTSTIKVLVAEKRASEWEVLSYVKMPSFGLRRGAVVNPEETAKNLQLLLDGVQKDCGQKIHSVLVNIGGSHLHVTPSDGLISVSRADHIISEEDRDRVLQATRAINIPLNEEILDVFPKEFIIDEERGIKQPIGLTGEQKEIGAAVIDIGSATTSLAVFEEGDLIHLAIFPLGSANITNDIAIGLRTDVSIAEDIKKQHGSCILQKSGKESGATKKKLEVSDGAHSLSFTKKQLVGIIEPRVSEILA